MNGKHICFNILDACDEAPQQFRSFLERCLVGSGRLSLSRVTIIYSPSFPNGNSKSSSQGFHSRVIEQN